MQKSYLCFYLHFQFHFSYWESTVLPSSETHVYYSATQNMLRIREKNYLEKQGRSGWQSILKMTLKGANKLNQMIISHPKRCAQLNKILYFLIFKQQNLTLKGAVVVLSWP